MNFSLDDAQQAVVARVAGLDGCLLVSGGPGSGKTTALVASVSRLVSRGVAMPEVVVLANTRPAAQRLRRDVMTAIGATQASPHITTVHGWCRALVSQYAEPADRLPRLLSAPDQEFRIRELLDGSDWPDDLGLAAQTPQFAGQLRALLTRARQLGLDPAGLVAAGEAAGRPDWVTAGRFFDGYLDVIDGEGVLDYAELVHRTRLLMTSDAVATAVAAHAKAVLVDEYAECDESVVALLRDIWRCGVPVTVFGDVTTAVFGFRGAWPAAMKRFPGEFAGADGPAPVIELSGVYRRASRTDAWLAQSPGDEPALVADRLWQDRAAGVPWEQMAVISRVGGPDLAALADGLAAGGVPARVEGELVALAEVPAVRLLLAGLELLLALADGQDAESWWAPVLDSPLAGPDQDETRRRIAALAARSQTSHVGEIVWGLWTLTDWPQQLRAASLARSDGALRADRDLDGVIALFDLANAQLQWRGWSGVRQLIELVRQQVVQRDRARESADPVGVVTVLSAYRAKGRGWPVVAVTGAVDGSWPMVGVTGSLLQPERLLADGQAPPTTPGEAVAEQRRLFKLATSRASDHLIVTGAPSTAGEPVQMTRFLGDMGVTGQVWQADQAQPTQRDLVGVLRAVAVSPTEPPGVADAAIAMLHRLRDVTPSADPARWWWVGGLTSGQLWEVGRPVRLAVSGVATLLACPRRWFLQQKAGASPVDNSAAWFGQVAHRLFEICATATPPDGELAGLLDAAFAEAPYAEDWRAPAKRQQMADAIGRFTVWRDGRPGRHLLGTEIDFSQQWQTSAGPVDVRGRVDRLEVADNGHLVVIDYKTSTDAKIDKHADQLGIYQLAASAGAFAQWAPGVSQVTLPEVVWPLVGPRRTDVGCRVDPAKLDADDGDWVLQHLAQAAAVVQSDHYDAKPGADTCRACPYTEGCPANLLRSAE